ncbi:hypothetical protein OS493_028081 [Desmophyllum pertusum]|uniref:Uncharacterized protein n=1 Tax=Desmophyllum pertusum TaxID=174260 RepID=A0A9W9ZL23_9CNID|nr:hypothetical protein OS493_028081 [Desmophyllum pertusum]
MLHAHKSLLRLDEKLRSLKCPTNTTKDKKTKLQVLEDNMQAQIAEVKKRQEALRKGLENMAREKGVTNSEIVVAMRPEVTTKQLDASSIQAMLKAIMPDGNHDNSGNELEETGVDDDSDNELQETGVDDDSDNELEETGVDDDSDNELEETGVDDNSDNELEDTPRVKRAKIAADFHETPF